MDTKQRRVVVTLLLAFVIASVGLWVWYGYEMHRIEGDGQKRYNEAIEIARECDRQLPSGNLSLKCQEFLGRK